MTEGPVFLKQVYTYRFWQQLNILNKLNYIWRYTAVLWHGYVNAASSHFASHQKPHFEWFPTHTLHSDFPLLTEQSEWQLSKNISNNNDPSCEFCNK